MYRQVLDPVADSLGWSSLFAALPLAALFVLLGVLRMRAWVAALLSLLVAIIVAVFVYPMPFDQAIVDAGAIRFRPMALTAAAVVVGSAVILFDPIFQGLAISLMAGEVASLLLSRMAVPVMYHLVGQLRGAS